MNNTDIILLIRRLSSIYETDYDKFKKNDTLDAARQYRADQYADFMASLIGEAYVHQLNIIENVLEPDDFAEFAQQSEYPLVYFERQGDSLQPVLVGRDVKRRKNYAFRYAKGVEQADATNDFGKAYTVQGSPYPDRNGKVLFLTVFPIEALVSPSDTATLTPWQRLIRLLGNEKKDIGYIYIYAIVVGLIGLTLPLGIQAIIGMISGGLLFSSVYVLVVLVILGIIFTGILQIIQISLVEILQRRVFAKAAFEFTYRIPRIRAESLLKYYPPELMNRFFDILTVQKALPKVLIDITAAIIQIGFGILLLSFYHPFFILFGVFTVAIVVVVIWANAKKGLETSMMESKYKYKIAQWLEDMARTLQSFKMAGSTNLPMQKTDYLLNNYLKYRKKHFNVLVRLFSNAIVFKAIVTGGLLVMGTFLVIDRQISLGQFVASEIIIVLVVGSVEKLIASVDNIFDLLTAVEKMGAVTDLPLERTGGLLPSFPTDRGLHVRVQNLSYKYFDSDKRTLNNISLELKPNERICLTGTNGSGKETLLKVLSGIFTDYQGIVTFNGVSIRDINLTALRDVVDKNISADDIFDGSLLENLTMGMNCVTPESLNKVLNEVNLMDSIAKLPEGLQTQMTSGGRKFSRGFTVKMNVARCVLQEPKLLIIGDILQYLDTAERQKVVDFLCDKSNPWTLIVVSSDPTIQQACDRTIQLDAGEVVEA